MTFPRTTLICYVVINTDKNSMDNKYSNGKHTFSKAYIPVSD